MFPTDTLQQKIQITDLKPFLAAENTSVIIIFATTVYAPKNSREKRPCMSFCLIFISYDAVIAWYWFYTSLKKKKMLMLYFIHNIFCFCLV